MTEQQTPTRNRRRLLVAGVALVVAAAATAGILALRSDDSTKAARGWTGPVPTDGQVVYEYHDAAVAPEFHRSYTLTVEQGSAHLVVFTYDQTFHDVTVDIDDSLWQRTLDSALAYFGTENVQNENCVGGTADELTVSDGSTELMNVYMSDCDGAATEYIRSAVSEVLGKFDLATMTAV